MGEHGASVVVGASGGIGAALVQLLAAREGAGPVYALSRSAMRPPEGVIGGSIDLTREDSIAAAFDVIREPIGLVIVATGLLQGDGMAPERSFAALDPKVLARSFQVNTIGPMLVAKQALPRLTRNRRAVFAVLSARVGSIEDNRLGGWYSYRASKAALNMMIRTLAIECKRIRQEALCVALHPGTVDTALSRPFQRSVRPESLFTPIESAGRLLTVIDQLTVQDSGGFFAYDGARLPF